VAKAVVLVTIGGKHRKYRVAVLPATRDVDLDTFSDLTRERVEFAKEYELTILFSDCAVGAVPALGSAYGLPTIIDQSMKARWDDIYFEAGDHEELIRVSSDQFRRLTADAHCAAFSHSAIRDRIDGICTLGGGRITARSAAPSVQKRTGC